MRNTRLSFATLLAALAALAASALTGCSGGAERPADAHGTTSAPSRTTTAAATPGTGEPPTPRTSSSPSPSSSTSPADKAPAGRGTSASPAKALWKPRPGLAWQWQLDGKASPSADVPVYDIDGFENSAADVARLHRDGRKVICYINVGAWEDFRPDQDAFPRSVLGEPNGWSGERWLDIRQISVLRPLMERRFDMCRDKGFDAVEPDLVEGYGNDTGFPLTARDQLRYNRMIAAIAHERGLSVGLKNDLPQIPQLLSHFDFAVNEECAQYDECAELTPFIAAGKAVFHVEYTEPRSSFCPRSRRLNLSSMVKEPELGVWRKPC
ncbi:endo alpha-1,4 polygalactosaminidase [Streptomyces sp. AC555_RSS877]|uniref:endo alpha-1,4 polygalactosaminidase n=1 Tax=Streptomyces sp. AC555_RSS877 TaxID=2823688 RepID=UPI0020B79294|nr:endo alpha-1,4 polygalactosaminidase [Streptomyces sp. AC555_RSS877]